MKKLLGVMVSFACILFLPPISVSAANNLEFPCALSVDTQYAPGEGHSQYQLHFTVKNTTDKTIFSAVIKVLKKDGTQITSLAFGGDYTVLANGLEEGRSISASTSGSVFITRWDKKDPKESESQKISHEKIRKEMESAATGAYCELVSFGDTKK